MALNVVNSVVGTTRTLASGDELIVTRDGVIAVDIGHGISVPHSDPFGIHIEGSVYATWAPLLINGDDTASYTSNIIVADTGIIRSFYNFYTVAIQRNGVDFENNGEITAAEASAILFYSGVDTGSLVNRGTITAYDDAFSFLGDALDATIDTFFVTNHGHMEGGSNVVSGRYENMDVVNTGTMVSEDRAVVMIRAAVQGVQPALSLNNLGLIQTTDAVEVVYGGFGHDEVINRGMIVGVVELDSGNDRVLNHGDIVGDVRLDNGSDYVFNAGTIQGDIYMGPGGDLLINWGGIDGNVDMGSTSMYTVVVRNTGHIEGSVTLGGASDKYYGLGGTASGTVYLGSGFDTAYVDQHGVVISGGADDDYVYAYDDVFVDAVEVVYARGALDVGVSVLQGPSTAYGNIGNNHFVNSGQHSVAFYGRSGDDRLEAGTSGDTLDGGAGNDMLIGGTGVDTMTGAAG
ncbi:hypothetical protein WNE31_16710, partial [Shimia sp. SDUM112013]